MYTWEYYEQECKYICIHICIYASGRTKDNVPPYIEPQNVAREGLAPDICSWNGGIVRMLALRGIFQEAWDDVLASALGEPPNTVSDIMAPGKWSLMEGYVARFPAEALQRAGHKWWVGGPGGRKKQLVVNKAQFCGLRTWIVFC